MSDESIRKTVTASRVATALLLVVQSAQFLVHANRPLHWVIGGIEIVAALLFVIPPVSVAGAFALIAVLAFAGIAHRSLTLAYPLLLILLITAVSKEHDRYRTD